LVVRRGEVWWVDLQEPRGSAPGYRHPLLILQADSFNESRLRTVVGIVVSSNLRLLDAPGNVLLTARSVGLPRDSVANVTQLVTVDKEYLGSKVGRVPTKTLASVAAGVRLALEL
jgi:mRNA interferase MazF